MTPARSLSEHESTSAAGEAVTGRQRRASVWVYLGLIALTLAAYGPALGAGFVWNDPDYVTPVHLRGAAGLFRIWFDVGATEQFYPVLHSAFWVQYQLWGETPAAYHVTNVLLHAGSACLLIAVLRTIRIRGAIAAGLVFALHPVCVESVAWISEQKNTLSLLFYLAAALVYLRFDRDRNKGSYALASIFFTLALLTKSVTATLPAALLVVIWWQRGRIDWRVDVRPLVPWFVGGAAFGLFTAWVEHHFIGAQGSDFELTLIERFILAGRVTWFYVAKIFWPADLVFIYPRWRIDAGELWQWTHVVLGMGLTVALWSMRRWARGPLAAWLFFIGSLFPTMGFFNVYAFKFSFVADHWQYLPCLGLIVFGVAAADAGLVRIRPARRWISIAAAAAVAAVLGTLTARQCRGYHDVETFYRTILARNDAAWLAHNNLGIHLVETGRVEEALPHFAETLRLRQGHDETEANLGGALVRLGRHADAAPHLEAALKSERLRRRSSFAELQANWAAVLMERNQLAEAIGVLETAVQAKPELVEAQNLLGLAMVRAGRLAEAHHAYEAALRLWPDFSSAHLNLGRLFASEQNWPEAARHYEAGLRAAPGAIDAHRDYAVVLLRLGYGGEAVAHLELVLQHRPDDAELRANVGLALAEAGRVNDGIAQCEEALRRSPGHPVATRFLSELRALRARREPAR
jgi:protein O-mannosyl-transferase